MVVSKKQSSAHAGSQVPSVLIIDDDVDILDALEAMLDVSDTQYRVMTAANPEQAKAAIDEHAPDIALIDIKLGRQNGLDLVPVLKRKVPDVVCIMMTAFRESEYAATAVRFGADDYLFKPLEPAKLFETLDMHFERQRLRREKAVYERRFQTLFQQSFQLFFLLDPEGRVLEANETARAICGMGEAPNGHVEFGDIPRWRENAHVRDNLRKLVKRAASGELIRAEMGMDHPRRQHLILDLSIKPLYGAHGEVERLLVEARDISERILAERRIRELNDTLERRVQDRTLELQHSVDLLRRENDKRREAEDGLRKAKESAEQANLAKSEFLSRMSHELRTPMNAVLGFAQLLQHDEESLSETQSENLEEILKAGEHLLLLINEVLDLSRIESGKLDLNLTAVNLDEVIESSLSMIRPLARQHGVKLYGVEYQGAPVARADVNALRQILINLLSNAVKYNKPGGEVRIVCRNADNGRVRIDVEDQGSGIADGMRERLFEPFDRLGRDYDVEGTGVGLPVALKLAEAMHGGLDYESRPGKGTCFWVELPLA